MATTTLVPVEEYLRRTEKPNAEYRDGVVYPKPMPTKLHSQIQRALMRLLEQQGVEPFPELTVRISPTKYFVPDVAVAGDFPGPYPTEPVLLCCEILSPGDRLGTAFTKCEEYHDWGVPYCWVIDPEGRTAWEYARNGKPIEVSNALHAGEITVSLGELFSVLNA